MSKKSLSVQVRHLENSRDNWKRLAQEILSNMIVMKTNPPVQSTAMHYEIMVTNWRSRAKYLREGDDKDAQE